MWARTRMAWGRRRASSGEPGPSLQSPEQDTSTVTVLEPAVQSDKGKESAGRQNTQPIAISSSGGFSKALPDYKFLHIYNKPEEMAAAVKHRDETLGDVPVPWVLRPRAASK
jgi:hypothetical protein